MSLICATDPLCLFSYTTYPSRMWEPIQVNIAYLTSIQQFAMTTTATAMLATTSMPQGWHSSIQLRSCRQAVPRRFCKDSFLRLSKACCPKIYSTEWLSQQIIRHLLCHIPSFNWEALRLNIKQYKHWKNAFEHQLAGGNKRDIAEHVWVCGCRVCVQQLDHPWSHSKCLFKEGGGLICVCEVFREHPFRRTQSSHTQFVSHGAQERGQQYRLSLSPPPVVHLSNTLHNGCMDYNVVGVFYESLQKYTSRSHLRDR